MTTQKKPGKYTLTAQILLSKKIKTHRFLTFIRKTSESLALVAPRKNFEKNYIEVSKMSEKIWISEIKKEFPTLLKETKNGQA